MKWPSEVDRWTSPGLSPHNVQAMWEPMPSISGLPVRFLSKRAHADTVWSPIFSVAW
jgi:hypothetical protein